MQNTGRPREVFSAVISIKKAENKATLMRAVKRSISFKDAEWYKSAYEQISVYETTKRKPSKNMVYQNRLRELVDLQI